MNGAMDWTRLRLRISDRSVVLFTSPCRIEARRYSRCATFIEITPMGVFNTLIYEVLFHRFVEIV